MTSSPSRTARAISRNRARSCGTISCGDWIEILLMASFIVLFCLSRIWKIAPLGLAKPVRRFHMNKPRRHFADSEKVAILKRHLIDKVPVSDLCDELDIYPNQFYDWLKKFFENGHLAFANGRKGKAVEDAKDEKIQKLEAKLQRKDSVLGELMEEHVLLKKSLGDS